MRRRGRTLILSVLLVFVMSTPLSVEPKVKSQVSRTYVQVSRARTKQVREAVMWVTAYTAGPESTGKTPNHPLYGITASGKKVKEWHTIAAGKSIPFGTKIYIPEFRDKPNGGIFVVEDRGGKVGDNELDVYMESIEEALKWGRRKLKVYILEGGSDALNSKEDSEAELCIFGNESEGKTSSEWKESGRGVHSGS